jgi:hypothetical protein
MEDTADDGSAVRREIVMRIVATFGRPHLISIEGQAFSSSDAG